MAITASEARKNLFQLIEQVNNDSTPIEIMSQRGNAVLISLSDYEALQETGYLLQSPTNAKHLLESISQAVAGKRQEQCLTERGFSSDFDFDSAEHDDL